MIVTTYLPSLSVVVVYFLLLTVIVTSWLLIAFCAESTKIPVTLTLLLASTLPIASIVIEESIFSTLNSALSVSISCVSLPAYEASTVYLPVFAGATMLNLKIPFASVMLV